MSNVNFQDYYFFHKETPDGITELGILPVYLRQDKSLWLDVPRLIERSDYVYNLKTKETVKNKILSGAKS